MISSDKVLCLTGLLAACLTPATQAATALTEFGALATVSSFSCPSDSCGGDTVADALLLGSTLQVGPTDGGAGANSANVAIAPTDQSGGVQASATVSPGFAVPVLKAGALGTANAWRGGQALVSQGYTYAGTGPEMLSLNWQLDGTILNPDADPVTGLVVFVGFFEATSLVFPDVSTPLNAFTLLASLALASPADNFLEFTASGAVQDAGTVSIEVNDGAQFYLVMGLMAGAGGAGSSALSLSTLTAEFAGLPAITPSLTAVPVPAAAWMLLSGLLPLAAVARRRGA
jgi:hypothetical protein